MSTFNAIKYLQDHIDFEDIKVHTSLPIAKGRKVRAIVLFDRCSKRLIEEGSSAACYDVGNINSKEAAERLWQSLVKHEPTHLYLLM
jgi:hypothetical protein